MSATKPSMLRDPKMPWMGPSCARSPWMPRIAIGASSRMPESTSSASETPEQHSHDVAERAHDLDRVAHEGDVDAEEGERDQVEHPHGGRDRGLSCSRARMPRTSPTNTRIVIGRMPYHSTARHRAMSESTQSASRPASAASRPGQPMRLRTAWVENANPTASRVSACANRAEPAKSRRARARCPPPSGSVIAARPVVASDVAARRASVIASPRAAASATRARAAARRAGARPPTAVASSTRRSR